MCARGRFLALLGGLLIPTFFRVERNSAWIGLQVIGWVLDGLLVNIGAHADRLRGDRWCAGEAVTKLMRCAVRWLYQSTDADNPSQGSFYVGNGPVG